MPPASPSLPGRDLPEERKALRRRILALRDAMPAAERAARSAAIAAALESLPEVAAAGVLLAFAAFRSEPATMPSIHRWLAAGKTVAVPRTVPGSHIEPRVITDPGNQLAPGFCGIPEPVAEKTAGIDPQDIAAVIVPGSVFDPGGGRLGYGGGYYDKFLAHQAPGAVRIAIAFDLQVVERVPLLPHDQPVDILVTESRVVRCRREAAGSPAHRRDAGLHPTP